MKKRIICLLISMIFVLGAFASCGEESQDDALKDIQEEASKSTITLSMYLVSENEISEDQEEKIEEAVNKITKARFKTQLDLRFFTLGEYYTALEEDLIEAKAQGGKKETAEVTEQTNEDGELIYPGISDYQVDIFYVGGQTKFKQYMKAGYLQNLNDEVANASKLLSSYITPAYLSSMKADNKGIYAIPTNKPIGEYTYLLLNKNVLKEMNYGTYGGNSDYSEFTSLVCDSCKDVLDYVDRYMSDEYVPLYSGTGDAYDLLNIRYFSTDFSYDENGEIDKNTLKNDYERFSLLSGSYNSAWTYGTENEYSKIANTFMNAEFTDQVKTLMSYKEAGYYATAEEKDKDFAVGYVKGGAEVIAQYGDEYEIVPVAMPALETADLYSDMFAVNKSSTSVSRSMEIVTYLNTNATFRNLLLYGIEGENYKLKEYKEKDITGTSTKTYYTVERLNNDYLMDVNKTGNVLLAYPLEDAKEAYNIREYQMQQNRDAKLSLVFGFDVANSGYKLNAGLMEELKAKSAEYYDKMVACKTVEELEAFFDKSLGEVNNLVSVSIHSNSNYIPTIEGYDEDTYGEGSSLAAIYEEWLVKVGCVPKG